MWESMICRESMSMPFVRLFIGTGPMPPARRVDGPGRACLRSTMSRRQRRGGDRDLHRLGVKECGSVLPQNLSFVLRRQMLGDPVDRRSYLVIDEARGMWKVGFEEQVVDSDPVEV